MVAFQAVDPGSIPGRRTCILLDLFALRLGYLYLNCIDYNKHFTFLFHLIFV